MNYYVQRIHKGRHSSFGYVNGADDLLRLANIGAQASESIREAFDQASAEGEPVRVAYADGLSFEIESLREREGN